MVDIPQLFVFPVSITVDSPENYTFALFGKDGALMDEKPLAFVKFNDHGKDTIQRYSQLCKQYTVCKLWCQFY